VEEKNHIPKKDIWFLKQMRYGKKLNLI